MMKNIKIYALALAFVAVIAVGAVPAFAAEPAGTTVSEKTVTAFTSVKATAAEVLEVPEESLAGLNGADELYTALVEADKLDEFKSALIAAKQAQYDAKATSGKVTAEKLASKMATYTETVNNWDGTTELVVSGSWAKTKTSNAK